MQAFSALADPTRRAIVELLAEAERPAGEIAAAFDMSGPAVSKHLRVLREAGVCDFEQRAQQHVYRLKPEMLREAQTWMSAQLQRWEERFDALGRHLDVMKERKK
ncbi:MAG: metalloregulator ArsR/SmtB family transcription factor [Dehalococcoidia bacterium]